MRNLFNFIGGFFKDQGDGSSSKRLVLYIMVYYFGNIINGMLEGKIINDNVLMAVVGIILFCVGAITSEFFAVYGGLKKNENGQN